MRRFSYLLTVRERACMERITSMANAENKSTAKDRAELLMYERYRRTK